MFASGSEAWKKINPHPYQGLKKFPPPLLGPKKIPHPLPKIFPLTPPVLNGRNDELQRPSWSQEEVQCWHVVCGFMTNSEIQIGGDMDDFDSQGDPEMQVVLKKMRILHSTIVHLQ